MHRALQRQRQQGTAGLHDLAGLHQALQHPGVGRGQQPGLGQAGGGSVHRRLRQRQLGGGLRHVAALVGHGGALGIGAGLLGLRHRHGAPGVVQPGLAEKALCHQVLRAAQVGLGGQQGGIGLRHAGLGSAAPGAAQPGQAGCGLLRTGLGLGERGAQFGVFQLHQRLAGAHAGAFGHQHGRHPAGDGGAQLHPLRRRHPGGEQQRAHQRCGLHHHRRHLRGARGPPCGGTGQQR